MNPEIFMKFPRIPNDFIEWLAIILGVTVAGLAGAGVKSWLDNVLEDSGAVSWVPGVAALIVFFVLAAPVYLWVNWSAGQRGASSDDASAE